MRYTTPELRALGSFAGLTMGVGGSCPDGSARNNNQLGGGSTSGGTPPCGPGTGTNP